MAMPVVWSTSSPRSMACFATRSAIGALGRISSANSRARSMADGASTKWLTTPNSNARLPSSLRPVKMSSFDLVAPISRGSRCVPPAPGIMPRRVSTNPSIADGQATRKSHASASSSPPPTAAPSITAIVGCGSVSTSVNVARRPCTNAATSAGDIVARSLRSAPAQNTFGTALSRTTTRTLRSNRTDATVCRSWATRSRPSALRASGRHRAMRATPFGATRTDAWTAAAAVPIRRRPHRRAAAENIDFDARLRQQQRGVACSYSCNAGGDARYANAYSSWV